MMILFLMMVAHYDPSPYGIMKQPPSTDPNRRANCSLHLLGLLHVIGIPAPLDRFSMDTNLYSGNEMPVTL